MGTDLDYGEIEEILQQIMGKNVSFEAMVTDALEGGRVFSMGNWLKLLGNVLTEQLQSHSQLFVYLLFLIISAAVLSTVAKAFRNRQISDMGFYMIYLLMFLVMMRSFGICYALTEEVIGNLIDFMRVLMPAFLMAAAAASYRTSAVVYYEGFLLLVFYLQKLVSVIVLPAIRCYVLFAMLGYLGKEDFFSRGREGLKKLISLVLKAMIGVTAGLQMVQGMISPAADEFKQTVLNKGISGLGNLGNLMGNVTDVVLGSGMLLKNGIGAAGSAVIVVICMMPVIQTGFYVLFYHFLAAVTEPVSDKRLTDIIGFMGDGIGLLVRLLFTVCAVFLLTIAIICAATGGIR